MHGNAEDDVLSPLVLREITIRRFRSLHDLGPLPVHRDLTVLTGENDGGKTATLDAIGFLMGSYSLDSGDRSHWAAEEDVVEVEGGFLGLDDPGGTAPLRLRASAQPGSARVIEILDRIHRELGARPGDLALNDLRARMTALRIPSPGGSAKAPYVAAVEEWLSDRPEKEFEDQWQPATGDELRRLPTFTLFSSVAAPSPSGHIQGLIAREARRLLVEERYSGPLAKLGKELDKEIAPSLEYLKKKIREYCPDLDDIRVDATFDFARPGLKIELQVRRQGELFDLEKAGEGRRRRVTLAIHETNLHALEEEAATSTELIAYDEPDTHLDYSSQRALFEILERQAGIPQVQVLVATHSLNFIDKVPLQSLLHFRLGQDLHTQIETLVGDKHEEEIAFLASVCAGLGLRNSSLLDERCFLVVEGDTEEAALPMLFRLATGRTLTAAGITLLNTKGSGSVRRLVEVLVKDWRRTAILVLDADTRAEIAPWCSSLGLAEGTSVYFIGDKEFEDAFSDEVWLHTFQTRFPPHHGSEPWTLDDVRSLRSSSAKYGEDLCNLARRRCGDHTLGKLDLGVALAEVLDDAEQIPVALRDALQVAQKATAGRIP